MGDIAPKGRAAVFRGRVAKVSRKVTVSAGRVTTIFFFWGEGLGIICSALK